MFIDTRNALVTAKLNPLGLRPAGFQENVRAAFDDWKATWRSISDHVNLEEQYDLYIEEIERASGTRLQNPIYLPPDEGPFHTRAAEPDAPNPMDVREARFYEEAVKARELAREMGGDFELRDPQQIRDDIAEWAHGLGERVEDVAARSGGLGTFGRFVGMAGGVFTDPAIILSSLYTPAAGASVLRTAVMLALVTGATEVGIQTIVQKYRKELGFEDAGFATGATMVGAVTAGGFVLGAAFKLAGMGLGKLLVMHRELRSTAMTADELAARAAIERFIEEEELARELVPEAAVAAARAAERGTVIYEWEVRPPFTTAARRDVLLSTTTLTPLEEVETRAAREAAIADVAARDAGATVAGEAAARAAQPVEGAATVTARDAALADEIAAARVSGRAGARTEEPVWRPGDGDPGVKPGGPAVRSLDRRFAIMDGFLEDPQVKNALRRLAKKGGNAAEVANEIRRLALGFRKVGDAVIKRGGTLAEADAAQRAYLEGIPHEYSEFIFASIDSLNRRLDEITGFEGLGATRAEAEEMVKAGLRGQPPAAAAEPQQVALPAPRVRQRTPAEEASRRETAAAVADVIEDSVEEVGGSLAELLKIMRGQKAMPKPGGVSLVNFLRNLGGVKDSGGELRAVMGGARARPGLLNDKTGLALDDAAPEAAAQAGYFPALKAELDDFTRPDVIDARQLLLDAIEAEIHGRGKLYPDTGVGDDAAETLAALAQLDEAMTRLDIDLDLPDAEIAARMTDGLEEEFRAVVANTPEADLPVGVVKEGDNDMVQIMSARAVQDELDADAKSLADLKVCYGWDS
tara:strand:- start:6883 stop:9306 length:2424 start_codon:yes stop_codon:yes gene_type:complete